MAKNEIRKDRATSATGPAKEEKTSTTAKIAQKTKPIVKKPESSIEHQITFDRWFAAKKFKSHWKAGMAAFVDVTGRRSFDEWERTFKDY